LTPFLLGRAAIIFLKTCSAKREHGQELGIGQRNTENALMFQVGKAEKGADMILSDRIHGCPSTGLQMRCYVGFISQTIGNLCNVINYVLFVASLGVTTG
jgi:hypothetical protein